MDARKQRRALVLTWLAYATYYLGRKGFSVVKKPIETELGVSSIVLGRIDTAYLTAYSIGQFVSGFFGDRIGARRLVGAGMLLSAAACVAFGSVSTAIAFGAIFAVNGLAQATGWPGTTRSVSEWTTPETRGRVMAFWSTSYQVGGLAAVWLAGFAAAAYGWRAAFIVPATLIASVALMILFLLPTRDASPPRAPDAAPPDAAEISRERRLAQLAVVKNPTLWFYSASYFFMKLIRYALLFWLPYYLATRYGYSTKLAAVVATAFDLGGIPGVIALNYLSDRSGRLGRAGLAMLSLVGLALAFFAYVSFGTSNVLSNVLLLALIGALLFGPDSILSGAAAIDAGGPRAAAMATGFVNGVGSIGPILQGLLIPPFAARYGWDALFPMFVVLSVCAAVVLVPTLRHAARARLPDSPA
jgi:sugar phosphate permease